MYISKMEIFKSIKNYENYSISNTGKLINNKTGKQLKTWLAGRGYEYCRIINKDGYLKTTIHRLVGTTFIENPNELPQIDHIDRNKLNNNVNNLRWCSVSENGYNKSCPTKERKNNKTGLYNITSIKHNGKIIGYDVRVKMIRYGYFNNLEDAIKKRDEIISSINNI